VKITEARVIITSPGRNFVSLKICTDEGLYGVGDATLNGRELAVSAYLKDHIVPLLVGRDPHQIEDIWQFLYRGAYWRKGPVTMTAISAVDMALWDIKAKAANMPLYQLLGGKSRTGVMVYGHANGDSIEETVEEVGKFLEAGYHAVRAQTGIPGLKSTYGVSKDKISHPCDGFGFLIPRNSGVRILGGMFLSGIFRGRSDSDKELIKWLTRLKKRAMHPWRPLNTSWKKTHWSASAA
jgi:mannonate dehydratase